jgi:hypothetical protein
MRVTTLAVLAATLLFAIPAHAQLRVYDPMRPARSHGSAGLGRSFAAGGNALFLNPAAFALASQYVLGSTYTIASQPDLNSEKAFSHSLGIEWTDSTPNGLHLAMALGYNLLVTDDDSTNHFHGSVAYVYRSPTMSFALAAGGHYSGELFEGPEEKEPLWSGDVGLGFNFLNQFMLGFVGYNLLNNHMEDMPKGFGGGLSYWTGPVVFAFDVSSMVDTTTRSGKAKDVLMSYIGGVQYMLVNDVFVRAAFRFDGEEDTRAGKNAEKSLAGGITAIIGQRVGFEVGYQHNIDAPEDFMVGVTIEMYTPVGH